MEDDHGKRLIIALVISMAFLLVYQKYFAPTPQLIEQGTKKAANGAVEPHNTPPVEAFANSSAKAVSTVPSFATTEKVPAIAAEKETVLTVRTPLYTVRLTNRGGVFKSFTLAKFLEAQKDPKSYVEMIHAPAKGDLPLGAEFTGAGGPLGFGTALFVVEGEDMVLPEGGTGDITFRYRTPEGLEMIKTFSFSGDSYAVKVNIKVLNQSHGPLGGRLSLSWAPGLGPIPVKATSGSKLKKLSSRRYGYQGAMALVGGKTRKFPGKKIEGTERFDFLPQWIASMDMYFTAAILPNDGEDGAFVKKHKDGRVEIGLWTQVRLDPGKGQETDATVYIGPKEMATLKTVDPSLTKTIGLGIFGIIAKPLLDMLNFFNKYVHNYGVSIIFLTILIKIFFIPFSTASHRSMSKMSKLQPKINALRSKYKKDKEKLNQEIMALYRENKVNPAGGCLPILVQIPVFFALYRALLGAIELRHAPFIFWITDLSAKDPYYVTPILMGVTMFLQQKMTPTTGDPRQAKIMMFMPVAFTVLFVNLPSGLVLYWTVNNILTIGHQYFLNKSSKEADAEAEAIQAKEKGKKEKGKKGKGRKGKGVEKE